VALFGVTGCGKSSIVNLLADKSVADVSTGVEACTKRARWYPISLGEKTFRLWDTMGFNQAETKDMNPLSPYEQAHALLRNLQDGGVDLLVFCKQNGRLSASELNNFRLFQEFLCEGQIPVAFIITHLEFHNPMEKWWEAN
ncbi:P-loop containing nucleoside triphosphate hydrolase protein, partial [Boletus edulis BED1]